MADSTSILEAMARDWDTGARRPAEDYIATGQLPESDAIDVIYQEYVLRRSKGERPDPAEYENRFPEYCEALRRQFELEAALSLPMDQATQSTIQQTVPSSFVGRTAHGPLDSLPPKIGAYEIRTELGRGGSGRVWLVFHEPLQRLAALKMLLHGDYINEHQIQKFLAEARTVAALRHPHVVGIYDFGEFEGKPYFVMEYVEGASLAAKLRDAGVWSPANAAILMIAVTEAVEAAHAAGIVHRDLKPGNILLCEDGTPKVADFGLARKQKSKEAGKGNIVGTPSYMAPEQAMDRPEAYEPAADIYSLGAILYELLTGRPPFQGMSVDAILTQVVRDEPIPPRRLRPDLPRDLETICLHCLRKEPQRRYASAANFAADLRRFRNGEPVKARPVTWLEQAWKWARREPVAAVSLALATVALVGGLIGMTVLWLQQREATVQARASELQEKEAKHREMLRADSETKALDRAEQRFYLSRITDAERQLEIGSLIPWAKGILLDCPRERRRWEWHHLAARVNGSDYSTDRWIADLQVARFNAIAIRPDGKIAIAGSRGRVVVGQGESWTLLAGHHEEQEVSWVAFDAEGLLVSADGGGRILWRDINGVVKGSVECGDGVTCVQPLERGRFAFTTSRNQGGSIVGLWTAGSPPRTLLTSQTPLFALAVMADGFLAAGRDGEIHRFDRQGNRQSSLRDGNTFGVSAMTISPDGQRLVYTAGQVSAETPKEIDVMLVGLKDGTKQPLIGHNRKPNCVAFHPNGQRVATAGMDYKVMIWDVATGYKLLTLTQAKDAFLMGLTFAADGTLLGVDTNGVLHRWTLADDLHDADK